MTKTCARCKQEKSLVGWHKKKSNKDGYYSYCPACCKEDRKNQYWKKLEENRSKSSEWYANNKEAGKHVRRLYARSHSAEATLRHNKWKDANPEKRKQVAKAYQARRRAAFKIPYSEEQMMQRFSLWNFKCWMCRENEFEAIEHVKPLSKGGWDCLSNIRPACTSCNSKKSAVWPYSAVLELFEV